MIFIIKHRRPIVGRLSTVIGAVCGLGDNLVSIITLGSVDLDLHMKWLFGKTAMKWDTEEAGKSMIDMQVVKFGDRTPPGPTWLDWVIWIVLVVLLGVMLARVGV